MKARHLLLVFGIALGARLLLYFIPERSIEEATWPVDCADYVQLGRNIAFHGIMSRDDAPPFQRASDRTPLYPLLIAGAFKIAPSGDVAMKWLIFAQFLFCALSATLCSVVAYLILKDVRWALVAGLLVGLEPYAIRYSFFTWSEPLYIFLTALALVLLLRHFAEARPFNIFLAGSSVCFALATLSRPAGQQVALLSAPLCLLLDRRFSVPMRVTRILLPFLIVYALVITPWVLRNYTALGVFSISSGAGVAKFSAAGRVQATADAEHGQRLTPREYAIISRDMLIAFLTEFIQKHPGYDDYPDWQVSPQEAIDRKLKSWPDVVPEELTGEWMEFLSTKSEHIIRTNLGLYLKSSLAMFVQMVFGFDKDALCHILKLTPSDARISDIGRKLITGKFREGLQRLGKVQMVEWVGLFWSALYAIPIPIFAVIGLYAMCDNAPTLGRLSSF